MGFEDDFKELDEEWTEAQANPSRPQMMPDGKHQAQVVESRVEQQDDGRWTWVVKFKNEEGSIRKFHNLDHEVGRRIAAEDAALMGYTGPLSGLEKACMAGEFDDLICEINIKPSKKQGADRDFKDIYVNRILGKGEPLAADEAAPTGVGLDDDIPF